MLLEAGEKLSLLYIMAKSLAELYSTIIWKSELVSDAFGYLSEDICKQCAEGMAWILGAVYSKMQEERDWWKELFNKKEPALDNLEILRLSRLQKTLKLGDPLSVKHVLERNLRMWLDNLLLMPWKDRKFIVFNHSEASLKWLDIWLMDPLSHLRRSCDRDRIIQKIPLEVLSCLMEWIPRHTKETHKVLENVVSAEKLPAWTESAGGRNTWKKAVELPKFYRQRASCSNYAPVNTCYHSWRRKDRRWHQWQWWSRWLRAPIPA